MNPAAYQEMASLEATHWWYVGRRRILAKTLSALRLPPQARLLEVGTGTGGNLDLLARHGEVRAVEDNPEALAIARARHPGLTIEPGRLPGPLPAPDDDWLALTFSVIWIVRLSPGMRARGSSNAGR